MQVIEKKLVQQILESDLDIQDKLDMLVSAGVPLGSEYVLTMRVTTKEVGTSWLDRVGAAMLRDNNIVSFSVSGLKERELGDDEWQNNIWVLPSDVSSIPGNATKFVTTGAQSGTWNNPNPVLLHVTNDDAATLCGKTVKSNWKSAPYDANATTFQGSSYGRPKKARICEGCKDKV